MIRLVCWWCLLNSLVMISCASRTLLQKQARQYQKGELKEDTSYLYQLPFEYATRHTVIEGYYSRFTHQNRAAIDFKMKKGTPVCAARDGIVIRVKDDSQKGGFHKKYKPYGNFVILEHNDSTRTSYRHLQYHSVRVQPGDSVHSGQPIARSGNTGYTFTPHLHFMVSAYEGGYWNSIPCRYSTKGFAGYLKPWHKYESINKLPDNMKTSKESIR